MKNFKLGFTLAEVLITLGIIGVVAAIVMPTVMTSHQYKSYGVKNAKFISQMENAGKTFVALNDAITFEDRTVFLDESVVTSAREGDNIILKDGTAFAMGQPGQNALPATVNEEQVGAPVITLAFEPNVSGLPVAVNRQINYVMTELGFVFPLPADNCSVALAGVGYETTNRMFRDNGRLDACNGSVAATILTQERRGVAQ